MPRGHKPCFTPEQDQEIARRYIEGETVNKIAASFGVSGIPVTNALKRCGVKRRTNADYSIWTATPESIDEILRLFDEGWSVKRIARHVHTKDMNISHVLKEAGLNPRLGGKWKVFTDAQAAQLVTEHESGLSLSELARRHATSATVIRNTLRRQGVESTYRKRQAFWTPERDAWLVEQYQSGRSQQDLADELHYSQTAIGRRLQALGATAAKPQARGADHGSWKGGRTTDANGYIMVKVPDEHLHLVPRPIHGGCALEHRLIMAIALGRPLTKGETVHHIDGNPSNNNLGNLQLRQGQHGKGVHMICNDCGSFDISAKELS
jgi:transposase-like protein